MDDEQLIELFLERDERAIEETQAAHGARLRQLAYRLLGNSEDAEIAKKYGYSETKVRSILFRTRRKLKKFLNGKGVHL